MYILFMLVNSSPSIFATLYFDTLTFIALFSVFSYSWNIFYFADLEQYDKAVTFMNKFSDHYIQGVQSS